ncbi:WGR domain-containing protein, predicted DNA-binding domain in MolR [Chitinophaga eiseniae]|uniref:WGR domain-containing protein, predicted DNA-binding domain in MolR n=1 Tax=Chitinophaga eiseniae TaxID=634771 RepID=A0A1T4KAX6_9BACT|nr:WGR domain-containing protein [Chitinophaga eiseniae]SJZ39483.1 WGR domain-containing protein, predicted DNA-binding domain in MolR [Chitinophaga eiseniae]
MKKKFIYQDDKSHKFWDITADGTTIIVTFGKAGTQGQTQAKTFATEDECRTAADKLMAEKTKKGYQPVEEASRPAEDAGDLHLPAPLYDDILAMAAYLEAHWPEQVLEIHPVSEAHIRKMETTSGLLFPPAFMAFWRNKGYFYFEKGEFLCSVYAYNDNAENATTLYNLLQYFLKIYRCPSEWLEREKILLSHCWMLGMIMNDEEKWFYFLDPLGEVHSVYIQPSFTEVNDDIMTAEFATLLAKKDAFQLPAAEEVVTATVAGEEETAAEEADGDDGSEARAFIAQHQLEQLSYQEVLDRLGTTALFDYWDSDDHDPADTNWSTEDYETERDYFEDCSPILFRDGDLYIDGDLRLPNSRLGLMVVKGNMTIRGQVSSFTPYYVTGDSTIDFLHLDSFQKTVGTENVRYIALAMGQDDEVVHTMPHRKINAPYFFSWFYNLRCFDFEPQTLITAMYNTDDLSAYNTSNALLAWHEYMYAFRPEFCGRISEDWHDAFTVSTLATYEALRENHPILLDGVTLKGIQLVREGEQLKRQDDFAGAYQCFKEATAVSPGYYWAYYQAGNVLYGQKAYTQAMAFFAKGIPLTPEKVEYEIACMQEAALCAAITGADDKAMQWAEMAVQKSASPYFCLRIIGEILIRQQRLEEAKSYLEKSIALKTIFSNTWLLGLIYHLQGNEQEADKYYKAASEKNKKVRPYTTHTDLSYFYGTPVTVNWDSQKPTATVKDQAYWDQFFADAVQQYGPDLYNKMWHKLTTIPEQYRSGNMLLTLMQHQYLGDYDVEGNLLQHFSPELITPEIALLAVSREEACHYQYIPPALLTDAVFQANPTVLDLSYVSEERKTYDLCFLAVCNNQYNFTHVPAAFRDERMNIALIAGGVLGSSSGKVLPSKYYTSEYIQQAIDLGIHVIERIPAQYVDKAVYDYAIARYSQQPEWPFIVEQFDRQRWRYGSRYDIARLGKLILHHGMDIFRHIPPRAVNQQSYQYIKKHLGDQPDFEEKVKQYGWDTRMNVVFEAAREFDYDTFSKVWACFWDEDFIISALTAHEPNSSERIYGVPPQYLTQKICDIAVKRNSYDFQFVPKQFVTPAMCENACSQHYGAALEYVPLAMRTEKVCSLALERGAETIRFVPLALRTVQRCMQVIINNTTYLKFVPYEHYTEVFTLLLQKQKARLYEDMMLVNLGLGLIHQHQYADARTQLLAVERSSEVRDHNQHQALYYTGWSYYLEGDSKRATEYWRQAQDIARTRKIGKEHWLTFSYDDFQLPSVSDVYEFSRDDFSHNMREAGLLIDSNNYPLALELLAQAEKQLQDAQCTEMWLWAQVWDHQRFALYEAGQRDASLEVCRKMITELGKLSLWDYLEEYTPIRAALRNAHNSLAYRCYETAQDLQQVKEGLQHIKTTMKTISPIEERSALYPFYETQALLWYKAMQFDTAYQKDFRKGMEKIDKMKLKEKGFLSADFPEKVK